LTLTGANFKYFKCKVRFKNLLIVCFMLLHVYAYFVRCYFVCTVRAETETPVDKKSWINLCI